MQDVPAYVGEAIDKVGLGRFKAQLLSLARPGLVFEPRYEPPETFALGESRIGGDPDVPPGFAWPWRGEVPMSFLAQFNMAELAPYAVSGLLPAEGMLHVFYETYQELTCEYRNALVLFLPATNLQRTAPPDELLEDERFFSCRLNPVERWNVPSHQMAEYEALHLSGKRHEKYLALREALDPTLEAVLATKSRLLGYPVEIQNGMQPTEDPTEWGLLMQIATEPQAGMQWEDCGTLYFWIRHSDLKAARFDRVYCELQFT